MKKMLRFTGLLFLFLIFTNCEDPKETVDEKPYFTLFNTNISNEVNDPSSHKINREKFERVYSQTIELEKILTHLDFLELSDTSNIKWIVFYSTETFKEDFYEDQNYYNGISLFYFKEGAMWHKIFQKNINGQFVVNEAFNLKGNENLYPKTLKTLAKLTNEANNSYFLVDNVSFKPRDVKSYKSSTNKYYEIEEYHYLSQDNLFIETLEHEEEIAYAYSPCNPMNCDGPPEVGCEMNTWGGLECRYGGGNVADEICAQEKINEEIRKQNSTLIPLNLEKARSFRDNFLKSSVKGNQYINYYYKLSYIMNGLDFSQKISLATQYKLALKLYEISDKVLYSPSSEIIFDKTTATYLLSHLDNLKSITYNKDYASIIDSLKLDVVKYTGKTKEVILRDF